MNTYTLSYRDPKSPFLKGKNVEAKNFKEMLEKANIDEDAIEGVVIKRKN